MRIVICHEFFYLRGGAERYMFDVIQLLRGQGHEVIPFSTVSAQNESPGVYGEYFVSQIDFPALVQSHNPKDIGRVLQRSIYSMEAKQSLSRLLCDTKPDLVHIFGFPQYLSFSILDAIADARVPAVQSMLDYKWLCPNSTFLSHGRLCEKCRKHRYHNVIAQRCKRSSFGASLVAALQAYYAYFSRSADRIALFICHSRFLWAKMIEYGYAAARLSFVPHFMDVATYPAPSTSDPVAVYFGRLSPEKGVWTLLRAIEIAGIPVNFVGTGSEEGPMRQYVQDRGLANIRFLGPAWGDDMRNLVSRARFVVCPSEWYENSPLAIYEAMAMGRPVIGARIGGIPELVQDGITGLTFETGNAEDLAAKMRYLMDAPDIARQLGAKAREVAAAEFTPAKHYQELMRIYEDAMAGAGRDTTKEPRCEPY